MSAFKTDREIRLECMKAAVQLTLQLKMPNQSTVGVARQLYDFVMEQPDEDETDEPVRGEVRRIG